MDLKNLASDIAKVYQDNPKIEAILLGGSVSRNWHDAYSDIELFIFWKGAPTDSDRKAPIRQLAGEIIDFHPYEDEEWSEKYTAQGVKLEISNFLTATINEAIEDVIESFNTDFEKQCLVAAVQNGVSLFGKTVVESLQEKVDIYPDELQEAMVREYIELGSRWNNREALLQRRDWLMLYKMMADVQIHIMSILFGLNRQYVHHPGFKWQRRSLEAMEIVPENSADRLGTVFLAEPEAAIKDLESILQEVYDLIRVELPHIDWTAVIEKSLFLRPKL